MSSMHNKIYFRTFIVYLCVTLFSLLFMGVYYAVDHGLRDIRMTLLFLPCLAVSVFFLILSFKGKEKETLWRMFFHMGFAAVYVYLVLSSVIAMADCVNQHVILFLILGSVLFLVSFVSAIRDHLKNT